MSSNRRSFLQMAGAVPALAASALVVARDAHGAADASTLTRSSFQPCIGDEFVFEKGAFEQCETRLLAIEGFAQESDAAAREGRFSLSFNAPGGLAQGTYRVSHARLGRFVLFVSPSGARGERVEAVFNRL